MQISDEKTGAWARTKNLPGQSGTPDPRGNRLGKWLLRLAWAIGVLLLLWLLAWLAVPPLVKWQAQKIASDKLGRQVTIGKIDFKPWSLEFAVEQLAIAKAGKSASEPQLTIRRLYIDGEIESLLRLAPVADAITVDEPVVSLTHLGDGRYDIDDILERLKTPPDEAKPAGEPPQFALYNLRLTGGSVDFTDQSLKPAARTHELRDLNIAVPFLSNLKSKREIKTEPLLAFRLNGSRFDTAAVATPFAQTRKSDATLKIDALDLKPYLGYLPATLPFRLQAAVLDASLNIAFEQTPATVVKLSGEVTANKVRLFDAKSGAAGGRQLLAFDQLKVAADEVRPLEQVVKLSLVELTAPDLRVTRDPGGQLNLMPGAPQPAIKSGATPARNTSAEGTKDPQTSPKAAPAAKPWQVEIARVALKGGQAQWLDETLPSPAPIALKNLEAEATAIRLPFAPNAPLQFKGSLALDPATLAAAVAEPTRPVRSVKPKGRAAGQGEKPVAPNPPRAAPDPERATAGIQTPATFSFSGTATDQTAQVAARAEGWPLRMASKYVGQFLVPALGGQLDAELGVNWQAARGDQPQALKLSAPLIALKDVQLEEGRYSLVSVKQIDVAGVDIDLNGKRFKATSALLSQPKVLVERDSGKRWMVERWLVANDKPAAQPQPAPASASANGPAGAPASAPAGATPWAVAIGEIGIDGGAVSFSDKANARPVAFEITALKMRLNAFALGDAQAKSALMPLAASLQIAAGRQQGGVLDFKGNLGLTPVQAQGALSASRLPVQAFEPYFGDALNIELLRADAGFKGQVAFRQTPAGPLAKVTGDASLEEFRANSVAPSEDLLSWKALNLRGVAVALDPGKATRVDVRETVLTDFFARVIVTPEGRINLQDLLKKPEQTAAATAASKQDATKKGAARARIDSAAGQNNLQNERMELDSGPVKTAAAATAPAPQAASGGPAPVINFGPMSLINGKVYFSDRFVKPNYSANLTELTGKLSAFSSVPQAGAPAAPAIPASGASAPQTTSPASTFNMADLELRGRAEGTASLEILGKLNPLAQPLALDITGKVRDLELPPLSPYAVKYAGYGINRGKLSLDVNYLVKPDGQLTAGNKLVLNQLSFGDKVEGAPASLPVKLAVALLADRNGVIDLDLPISGSLNDPQFRLGPVIVKVILNVITKAITAPFSLLANAFGGAGGDELSSVSFAAGSAQLGAEAKTGLDKVAKALNDRPALKLTVVGTSSLEAERDGYKRARLDDMVRAEKRRATVKGGGSTQDVQADTTVSPAEYPELLKEVYKRADMPKPRNAIGLAKDLPDAEMEKLLLADIKVTGDAMRELAVQRGVAVKDYLAAARLPTDRLFLGAAKIQAPDAKWTPRAELNLGS
jgi:Domain of Unknown Function (DUF748)